MAELDDRAYAVRMRRHEAELDRIAEQVIILDERARAADDAILGEWSTASQWREKYAWNIDGFLEHYRRSSSYAESELVELTELGMNLVRWAAELD
ncbi:hypothetical protein [Microbacterium maritypicum]